MSEDNYKKAGLRRGIDYIGLTCVFFCHDGKGNLLMHKRSRRCRDEIGRWDCGSGSMEFGETFEKAAIREIREEYCVTPSDLKFCGVTNVIRRHNGKRTHWVALIFTAKVDPRKAKMGEPEKMDGIAWFKTNKLPKPLHSMLLKHLAMARKSSVRL